MADGYKPNQGMKSEAKQALEWRAEYNRGGTPVGVARARDIINGRALPLSTVKRMTSFFARHEVDKQAEGFKQGEAGYPSAGRIAWGLWGGDAGRSWANAIADKQRAAGMPETEESLTDRQEDMLEAFMEIANEYGAWDQSSGPDGAHYASAANNPFSAEGLACTNCVFYQPGEQEGRCAIVTGPIEPLAVCKLWIIEANEVGVPAVVEPVEEPEEPEEASAPITDDNRPTEASVDVSSRSGVIGLPAERPGSDIIDEYAEENEDDEDDDGWTEEPGAPFIDDSAEGRAIRDLIAEHAATAERRGAPDWKQLTPEIAAAVARRAFNVYATRFVSGSSRMEDAAGRLRSFSFALLNDRYRGGTHDQDLLPSQHPLHRSGRSAEVKMNLNMETRNLVDGAELRVEQTDNGLRFSGYAAMFDSPSSPLPFTERIAPKAFADSLSRAARGEWVIKLLHGHDASQMLASTASGSLRLSEDDRGLRVDADLIPSEMGKHIALLVDREGPAMSMSFGFTVPKGGDKWDGADRTLTNVRLMEVSILSGHTPAYPATAGMSQVRAVAERAGIDPERLSWAIGALSVGNMLEDEDAALIAAAADALRIKRKGAPASTLRALAMARKVQPGR
jgi:hypothetical protein